MDYNTTFKNLGAWDAQSDQADVFRVDPSRVNINSRFQYRHKLDQDTINAQAIEFAKVAEKGHIPKTVVLVVSSNAYEYDYEIVFGAHRVAAAKQAGTQLLAMSGDGLSEAELRRIASSENLLRVAPNPLEITEDILRTLEATHGLDLAKVKSLLSWNSKGRKGNNVVPQEWDVLEQFLLTLPKPIKPTTFHKKYIPLLDLPPAIMDAVRSGRLDYTKALELRKLPDAEALVDEVVSQEWPLSQIKDYAREQSPPAAKMPSITKRIAKLDLSTLEPEKQRQIQDHLSAIEALLGDVD